MITKRLLGLASLLTLAAATFPTPRAQALCSATAYVWQCWEGTVDAKAGTLTANPYRDVRLKVTFTKPGQPALTAYAFWDGGTTFKFRMALPEAGPWTYSTVCEQGCPPASGLAVSGAKVSVTSPANRTHPLYGSGFLKASGQTLAPALHPTDPFFWMGDTAWAAPVRATPAEWTRYLSDRVRSGFNVIQIAMPVDWMRTPLQPPADASGQVPFEQVCDSTDPIPNSCSRWNPGFWRELDRKVQEANDQGLHVLLVGLMDRVVETAVADGKCAGAPWPGLAESATYARNVAARLSGSYVVFSPAFDRVPDVDPDTCAAAGSDSCQTGMPGNLSCRMRCVGETIRKTVPRHLVTNHFGGGTPLNAMQWFQDQPWLDFQMFQSGQAKGQANCNTAAQLQLITQRPREIALGLWGSSPTKPVVNGEAIYDGGNGMDSDSSFKDGTCQTVAVADCLGTTHYNPYRARQAGYLSGLSGAVGYGFGVKGIFDWGGGMSRPVADLDWAGGAARRSSAEMKVLGSILGGVGEELVPAHGLIANQVPDAQQQQKMVAARTVGGTRLLAYLPDNPQLQLDLSTLPKVPRNGHWQNPRTGESTPRGSAVGVAGEGGVYTYSRPACSSAGDPNCATEPDWVLSLP